MRFTSMQSPAFARRMSGSTGTPFFSSPFGWRSSVRTYMMPCQFASALPGAPRPLKTIDFGNGL